MKIIFALLLVTMSATAQNTIGPGDKHIRQDWIKPSHNFNRGIVTDSTGKVVYDYVLEDFTIIDPVTKQITFARSRQVPPGSFSVDTSFTDQWLTPIRMHEIFFQRGVAFEMSFGDTLATVKTTRKGVLSMKTYPMKRGYFEDNMIEYIVGWLDLEKGVTYTLDNFNKDTPKPSDPYTIEYVFDDLWLLTGGGKLACSVLHYTHGGNEGYFWIDKATRETLKEEGSFKGMTFVLNRM